MKLLPITLELAGIAAISVGVGIELITRAGAVHLAVTSAAPAGTNALSDETKNWAANAHRNRLVKIIRGAGAGPQPFNVGKIGTMLR